MFDSTEESLLPEESLASYKSPDEDEVSPYDKIKSLTVQSVLKSPALCELFDDLEPLSYLGKQNEDGFECSSPFIIIKAHDAVSGKRVCIKCTNPLKIALASDGGREITRSIEWEEDVTKALSGKKHLPVLNSAMQNVSVSCSMENGEVVRDRIQFFSTEFLPYDIKKAFFDSRHIDDVLSVSRAIRIEAEILRTVRTLHRLGLCHRDLKPSNLMGRSKDSKINITAIDLETSLASKDLKEELSSPLPRFKSTLQYASPELRSGLVDDFETCIKADYYAAGCMLFELLDRRTFNASFIEENGEKKLNAMYQNLSSGVQGEKSVKAQKEHYFENLLKTALDITLPKIRFEADVPPFVAGEIQKVFEKLCVFDIRKRAGDDEILKINEMLCRLATILEDRRRTEFYRKKRLIRKERRLLNAKE